jgi:methylated-DNA-protein-cysteine methyltransferase related protein
MRRSIRVHEKAYFGRWPPANGAAVMSARGMKRLSRRQPETTSSRRARVSDTYRRIYAVIARIPRGRVATYGQVATLAGLPHAPRVAGYALHALHRHSPLPWFRVVGAGGRLSLARLDPSSATTQRMRLEREGVAFDPRGRVAIARFQWRPRRNAADTRRTRTRGLPARRS